MKLEDLMVLKRSPDLINVKIGQDQLWRLMKHFLFYFMGVAAILVKWPKKSNEYSITAQWFLRKRFLEWYVAVKMSGLW